MQNPKKIALFLDGTWNVVSNNTNVWRLKTLCEETETQIAYYSAGVGTQLGTAAVGGGIGYGLDQGVIDAYEWLIEHYNDNDEIFILGFSRGAYTARSLAGLISKCGLLKIGSPLGVGELYDRYRLGTDVKTIRELQRAEKEKKAPSNLQEKWLLKYCKAIPVRFIGVWDTVGALGIPIGHVKEISTNSYNFLETDLRINESFAYHALAVDEHRKKFAPTFWTTPVLKSGADAYPPRPIEHVEQRWFVGAHADVGGGYNGNLLSQIPLKWLMDKAINHGLQFQEKIQLDGSEITDPSVHDSYMEFLWGIFEWPLIGGILQMLSPRHYRPIGVVADPKQVPSAINETIDASVFERWRKDSTYRPKNLVEWASKNNLDPALLTRSVRADDPRVIIA